MTDLDRLLRADISHAAEEAVGPPDFATIRHRGDQRRRTHAVLTAAAAAVVVALVVVGGSVVVRDDRAAPSPAAPASPPSELGSIPSGDGAENETIEPGTYSVQSSGWSAVDFTIAFPEGWTAQYGHIYHGGTAEEVALEAAVVDEVFTDACRGGGALEPVGPRVQDLVKALRTQPGPEASKPVHTTLGGYPATRVDLRVPEGLDLESCRLADDGALALQIWYSEPVDNFFVLFPHAVASVYVLDVDGRRQVFVAQNRAPDSPRTSADLQSVLDSIRIQK